MALQKQLVHLNFTNGLQRKDDEKTVIPTKLTVADNVEFDDKNTIIRRNGQVAVGSGGTVAAVRMYEHDETAHIELANGSHVRRSLSGVDTPYKLNFGTTLQQNVRVAATLKRIQGFQTNPKNSFHGRTQRNFDVAVGSTTYCLAYSYVGSNDYIWYTIRSLDTDAELFRALVPTSGALNGPRVIYEPSNSRYYLFFTATAGGSTNFTIYGMAFSQTGATVIAATSLISATGANTVGSSENYAPLYDVSTYQSRGFTVAARGTSNDLFVCLFNLSLAGISAVQTAAIGTQINALTTCTMYPSSDLTGHVFYNNLLSLRGRTLPASAPVLSAENTIGSATFSGATRLGRMSAFAYGSEVVVVSDVFLSSLTTGSYVMGQQIFQVAAAHTLTDTGEMATRCCIAARSFTMNSRQYIPVVFDSRNFQRVVLVLDVSAALYDMATYGSSGPPPMFVARLAAGEVASYVSHGSTPLFLDQSPSTPLPSSFENWLPVMKYDGNSRLAGTTDVTPASICRVQLDYDSQLGDAKVNGVTYLAGAMPLVLDGSQIVEEGFHWGPETPENYGVSVTNTGSGFYDMPSIGTYSVAFTYAWQDARGNWHESAPSPTMSITTSGGFLGVQGYLITPPSLKNQGTGGPMLLMYRTLVDSTDTTLYLAHAESLAAGVTMVDTSLVSGETLYTEGGVLPNNPMPPCRQLSIFQKRLVASGCDDGQRVFWSKQVSPGFPAEFSTTDLSHQTTVPDAVGRVVGAAEIDDKLMIVCESGVGAVYGQGPAATGTQGQYSDFTTISSEIGGKWDSPKSVIKGPEGVWFRSPFGIRLLSRGGGIARGQDGRQAGSEVDDLLSSDSVIAVSGNSKEISAYGSKQQIRFYLSSGSVLIWDYQWQQWTRFTGVGNIDAAYVRGLFMHVANVSTTPLLRYFGEDIFVDVNDAGTTNQDFTSTLATGWLSFAGLQGFQRIYRLMLTGNVPGGTNDASFSQRITGSFSYDFTSTVGDSFTTTQIPNSYGSIQIQHHMAKQKCEAMKITITFRPFEAGSNEGRLRLTDLTLQVGVKPGYFKLPSGSRV